MTLLICGAMLVRLVRSSARSLQMGFDNAEGIIKSPQLMHFTKAKASSSSICFRVNPVRPQECYQLDLERVAHGPSTGRIHAYISR